MICATDAAKATDPTVKGWYDDGDKNITITGLKSSTSGICTIEKTYTIGSLELSVSGTSSLNTDIKDNLKFDLNDHSQFFSNVTPESLPDKLTDIFDFTVINENELDISSSLEILTSILELITLDIELVNDELTSLKEGFTLHEEKRNIDKHNNNLFFINIPSLF